MNNEDEKEENSKQEFKLLIMDIKDSDFEEFQNTIKKELILDLYSIFRTFEKNGIINYEAYLISMTEVFKKYNESTDFKYIFDLIFNRFQKIKCTLKNNKTVFYLTDIIHKNAIETYIVPCFLTLLLKCSIIDKIKLLFKLTDTDEDGFLNKAEIKLMISTINFFFCENSENNFNSSIITQSLMNIKVKEKLNKLMHDPGGLANILKKEKVVNFDIFFECLEKIENYKYEIIPCFINIKKCLYNQRKEKIIEVKNKNKKEFVRISSALSHRKFRENNQSCQIKKNASANLEKIIKVIKTKNEQEENKNDIINNDLLLGLKENNKSFKDLLKERTIFTEKEREENFSSGSSTSRRSKSRNQYRKKILKSEYFFVADYDKIKKLEVEPALLKFETNKFPIKKIKGFNSNYSILNSNPEKKNIFKKLMHKNTFDLNRNIHQRIQSVKNNKMKINSSINSFKRRSIQTLNYKNNIFENLSQIQNFNFFNKNNTSKKNITFSKDSLQKIYEKKNSMKKTNKNNFRKINNINIYRQAFNNRLNHIKLKRAFNNKSRNTINKFTSLNESSKNKQQNLSIKILKKNLTLDKTNTNRVSTNNKFTLNKTFFKTRNGKNEIKKNKIKSYSYYNSRMNRYLNIQEILKDLAEEKRIAKGDAYTLEKELGLIYLKLEKEKTDLDDKKIVFNEDDFSWRFFDLNEKNFPNSFRKKINPFIYKN